MVGNTRDRELSNFVLLVDDNDDLREALTAFLERRGFRVVNAPGGNEAIAIMKSVTPSVVLLDWNMPDPNGRKVLDWMTMDRRIACVPTYIVTTAPSLVDRKIDVIDKHDTSRILQVVVAHCGDQARIRVIGAIAPLCG